MVLTLTRVVLSPRYPESLAGSVDPLTEDIAADCSSRLRRLAGYRELLGDLCGRFVGRRRKRGLRNEEVRLISEAAGEALALTSPAYYLVEEYGFGLTSHRVKITVEPRTDDPEEFVAAWRQAAQIFRRALDRRIELERASLASQYFAEVYAFYELPVSPARLTADWEKIERILIPDNEGRKSMASPLKWLSPPRQLNLAFAPDPVYASGDGIFAVFFYSEFGAGKRRNVHSFRRKTRRIFRLAIDMALGLKVFLDNEDLWLLGQEDAWVALTGMIYLSP